MELLKKKNKNGSEIIEMLEIIKEEIKDVKNMMNMLTDECLIDSCIYRLKALERQYQYFIIEAKEKGIVGFEKIS